LGAKIEIANDGVLREVAKSDAEGVDFSPALLEPASAFTLIEVWPWNASSAEEDFHLNLDSPSVDSGLGRPEVSGADLDGAPRVDVPGVPNAVEGDPPYIDRGAYEYQPPP
jgi:hypothetical protein